MAQQTTVRFIDDLDGADAAGTFDFALDGRQYQIDLSDENATKLRDALAPYVAHARPVSSRSGRRTSKAGNGPAASEIRAWARDNGFTVPDRGRVAAEVREAYAAAH